MVKEPLVSVVISNWNCVQFLEKCISSVLTSNYENKEVILVDDASTDGSIALVKSLFGNHYRVTIMTSQENKGLAAVLNRGVGESRGEYIVFMHSDTYVDPDWLKPLVYALESDTSIGAVQGKILSMEVPDVILGAGHTIDYFGYPLKNFGWMAKDTGQFDQPRDVFGVRDACMMVRRRIMDEVGQFDPAFFFEYEEIDLCWRIWLRGYRVVYVPQSKIWHKSLMVAHALPVSWTYHRTKNHLSSFLKNYGSLNLLKYFPFLVILYLLRIPIEAMTTDFSHGVAIVRGLCWVLRNIRYIISLRRHVQKCVRHVPDEAVKRLMERPNLGVYMSRLYQRHADIRHEHNAPVKELY